MDASVLISSVVNPAGAPLIVYLMFLIVPFFVRTNFSLLRYNPPSTRDCEDSPRLSGKKGTPLGMPFTHQVGSHNQLSLFHCNIINQPFSCYGFYIKNHSDHLHYCCHLLSIRPQLRINKTTFRMLQLIRKVSLRISKTANSKCNPSHAHPFITDKRKHIIVLITLLTIIIPPIMPISLHCLPFPL